MWIKKTNFGIKRFVTLLLLICIPLTFSFGLSSGVRYTFIFSLIAYLGLVCVLIYQRGIVIREARFSIGNTAYEVRKHIYFRPHQTNTRVITVIPSEYHLSSMPLHHNADWTYFPFIKLLIAKKQYQNALVLGGGGGSVPYMLLRDNYCTQVDAIEKYPRMISVAIQYMLPHPLPKGFHFIRDDAKQYVTKTNKKYDVIFVDIFEGDTPKLTDDRQFIRGIARHITKDGILIVNLGFSNYMNILEVTKWYREYIPNFTPYLIHKNIIGINRPELQVGDFTRYT